MSNNSFKETNVRAIANKVSRFQAAFSATESRRVAVSVAENLTASARLDRARPYLSVVCSAAR